MMDKTRQRFANRDTVRKKYAGTLSVDWVSRSRTIALVLAAFAMLVFGLVHLEFSPARMIEGVGKLGTIAYLMLPPNPESWAKVISYAISMGETLAILKTPKTKSAATTMCGACPRARFPAGCSDKKTAGTSSAR